jgi:hypothetical protein
MNKAAKRPIRDWMCRGHLVYWQSTQDKDMQTASFLSPQLPGLLHFYSSMESREVTGLLTGHCRLKRHLFKLGYL